MQHFSIVHFTLDVLPLRILWIAATALSAVVWAQPVTLRAQEAISAAPPVVSATVAGPRARSGVTKERAAVPVESVIIAHACAGCAREAPAGPKPLLSALPAGESFEVRMLKNASSGFRLRASDANAPASADERLRFQVSRRYVGIAWSSRF